MYGRGRKTKNKSRTQNIRNPFILKKKKIEIKDRIIRDIWTLFETEEEKMKKEIRERKKKLIID